MATGASAQALHGLAPLPRRELFVVGKKRITSRSHFFKSEYQAFTPSP
jgi:hypothetical protein